MTKLISPYPGIIVYKDKNGRIISRAKPGPNKKIKTHPQFQRTREQGAAFGKAASAGKMIRYVFSDWVKKIGDSYLTGRLAKELQRVIKTGTHEDRMEPKLVNGDLSLLDGFQFNPKAHIDNAFFSSGFVSVEKKDACVEITIPSFVPAESIDDRKGDFSHFRIIPLVAAVNLQTGDSWLSKGDSGDPVACDNKKYNSTRLKTTIDLKGDLVVIITLGIEFYWLVGEKHFSPVAGGGHNALGIIKAYKLCVS